MEEDVSACQISGKRLTGEQLKIFFTTAISYKPAMVLDMEHIAAFIDHGTAGNQPLLLRISKAGSYGADTAMRLQRPGINDYQEVFLFTDTNCTNWCFRGLAKQITWRPIDNQLYDDFNY
ncbi:MAG: hypothetical protein JST86_12170 [Bacteroidetes bacterium]|nr:hypothetical protein [Bacteroidota bacterium]